MMETSYILRYYNDCARYLHLRMFSHQISQLYSTLCTVHLLEHTLRWDILLSYHRNNQKGEGYGDAYQKKNKWKKELWHVFLILDILAAPQI